MKIKPKTKSMMQNRQISKKHFEEKMRDILIKLAF